MFHPRQLITSFCLLVFLTAAHPALAQHSGPTYADDDARQSVTDMIDAHGGMQAWDAISSISFMFFTRNSGAPEPWLSRETIHTPTGRAYLDWPVLEAAIVWDGSDVWSDNWPPFAPPGASRPGTGAPPSKIAGSPC